MAKGKGTASSRSASTGSNPFTLRKDKRKDPKVHIIGKGIICDTEARGNLRPRGQSPTKIVVDASEGFVPLWVPNTTLRWRFRETSMHDFENPSAAKKEIRELLGEALLEWSDAAPVKFSERDDAWDFEIVVMKSPDCDASGCVLASAFFPDAGRHKLTIYPTMFTQSRTEQVETLIHEIGHTFGLRHFFANISETQWASEVFGTHKKFTIMNYGENSHLTPDDKSDLKRLYELAWSGTLTNVNGTPIKFVKPFHTIGESPANAFAVREFRPVYDPRMH